MSTTTKSRKATIVFEPATFNRCTVRATGEVFYTVKGNSDTYKLTWNEKNAAWECNCPSAIKARPCKHEVALSEHLKARQEVLNEQQAAVAEVEKILSETKAAQVETKECDRCFEPASEYQVKDRDIVCAKCIQELEAEYAEREAANYGKIVNGKIVNVRWSELTSQEQADAYRNYVSLLSNWQ